MLLPLVVEIRNLYSRWSNPSSGCSRSTALPSARESVRAIGGHSLRGGNFLVTLRAGRTDVPVAHRRLSIARRQNAMLAMAVRANGRIFAVQHGPSMDALQILLDRMKDRNLVARQNARIRVALCAGRRLIFLRHFGSSLARRADFVHGPVAREASGRVGIAGLCCLSVNAFCEFFCFRSVTFGALSGLELRRRGNFMDVSVTGGASLFTQNRVNAFRGFGHLFRVACLALYFHNLRGVREIFDRGMAVGASENPVDVRRVLHGPNKNALALFGFHIRLAVTGEAGFILLERLSGFLLASQ